MSVQFQRAERKQKKLKLAFSGPSGSGKTYMALAVASGLGPRIAVIDTENGSASLYADKFAFDTIELAAPYEVEKYVEAIEAAAKAGYDAVVVDSISHQWSGEGGALETVDRLQAAGKHNKFTAWGVVTPKHNRFRDAILQADIHLIATMRSKTEYLIEEVNGKKVPKKVGMAPEQRSGMEYEFDMVMEIDLDHTAHVTKTRFDGYADKFFPKAGQQLGKELLAWLASGKAPRAAEASTAQSSSAQESSAPGNGNPQAESPKGISPEGMIAWMKQIEDAALAGGPALVQLWTENKGALKRMATPEQFEIIVGWKDAAKSRLMGGAA